jgi:hypothetical protein
VFTPALDPVLDKCLSCARRDLQCILHLTCLEAVFSSTNKYVWCEQLGYKPLPTVLSISHPILAVSAAASGHDQ